MGLKQIPMSWVEDYRRKPMSDETEVPEIEEPETPETPTEPEPPVDPDPEVPDEEEPVVEEQTQESSWLEVVAEKVVTLRLALFNGEAYEPVFGNA